MQPIFRKKAEKLNELLLWRSVPPQKRAIKQERKRPDRSIGFRVLPFDGELIKNGRPLGGFAPDSASLAADASKRGRFLLNAPCFASQNALTRCKTFGLAGLL